MLSLSLSWQLIISFSRATSLSITDGSDALGRESKGQGELPDTVAPPDVYICSNR